MGGGRLFCDLFNSFDNGPHSDPIVVHEFVRLPTMRDLTNGEFMDLHALRGNRAENGIAKAAVGIMIFHREDAALASPCHSPARWFYRWERCYRDR